MVSPKFIDYPEIGSVEFVKRRGQKSIRLRVQPGKVRVSMPHYTPLVVARKYFESKIDWVKQHQTDETQLSNGMHIGKNHILRIGTGNGNRSKISENEILVCGDDDHIKKTVHRALKKQSENLLTQRVASLARDFSEQYTELKFRQMVGRWGSCSSKNELTFNIYLIQLPWPLIDYVIIHELCHLKHMDHSKEFWKHVTRYVPDYKQKRKTLSAHRPVIYNTAYAKPARPD